jgi:hypothetical protein
LKVTGSAACGADANPRIFNLQPSTFNPRRKEAAVSEAQRYDAIVIGAGQGGGPLSTALAR